MTPLKLSRGKCLPLGATQLNNSINFALLCRHGTEVHLALFTLDSKEAIAEIKEYKLCNDTDYKFE